MYKKLLLSLALSIGLILTFAITSSAATGDSWTAQSCGTTNNINGVCYSGSMFVAVGDGGTIVTSADGKSWTNQTSANSAVTGGVNLKAVCFGNNIFMAVGEGGKVITSPDGESWGIGGTAPNDLVSVCYGTDNTFVAVGKNQYMGGYIYTSTNGGVSWEEKYSYTGFFLNAVCYDGSQFIVVGDLDFSEKCKILTSTNGLDWNDYSSDQGDQALTCVCSNGGTCVAGDIQSRIMTSTDSAVTWVNRSWQDPDNCCFNGVCYGDNTFVIVGAGGKIYTSADGATWNSKNSGTSQVLNGVCYGGGTFVAVGSSGTVLTSGGIVNTPPTVSTNTGITVDEGSSGAITNSKLKTTDAQTTDASLITYTLTTVPSNGTLYNNGSALAVNSTFTQANIDNSKITYTHKGTETTTDSFGFSVSDGVNTVSNQTFNITITPVNDAPVLTPKAPDLTSISADNTTNSGQTVASFVGASIGDSDSGALMGIAITDAASGNGSWQYSIDAGDSWTGIGTVSESSALLLRSSDLVRFVPDGVNVTTASITYKAWDRTSGTQGTKIDTSTCGDSTAFSTAEDTATISVTDVNDAPVLTASSPVLTSITEDDTTNNGQVISSFLGNSISDADTLALEGIAVTGLIGNGKWQYSKDGGSWNDIGTVSVAGALLLKDTDKIRYVPDGENSETASITYKAWDQTSGTSGSKIDITTCGGKTSISLNSDTASLGVTAVNDAPELSTNANNFTQITEDEVANSGQAVSSIIGTSISDVDTGAVSGIAVTASTAGNGAWQYSIDNGTTWKSIGQISETSALLLKSTDKIRFVPNGEKGTAASITYRAWDQTTGLSGGSADASVNGGTTAYSADKNTANITVTDVNDKPTLSSINKLTGAVRYSQITITYADLAAASDAADVDSSLSFKITGISSNGSLNVAVGAILSSGGSIIWTPSISGESIEAFTVKAYDGTDLSDNAVSVLFNVDNVKTQTPTVDVSTGSTVKKGTVITLSSETDSTIYYTVGVGLLPDDPTNSSNSIASGKTITIDGSYGQTITVKAYALFGDKLSSSIATFTYTIQSQKKLTITNLSVQTKEYDGTNTATLTGTPELNGVLTGDIVTLSGAGLAQFSDKNAGENKTVTVSGYTLEGTDAQYYTLEQPTLTGVITKKQISVNTVNAENKTYDKTDNAIISSITLNSVCNGDSVSVDYAKVKAIFSSIMAGPQFVIVSGISLTGDDAANYTLDSPYARIFAVILPKEITPIASADSKVYDGTGNAAVDVTFNDVIATDSVTTTFNASYADLNAGTGKTVNVTDITLGGSDCGNYILKTDEATATADITQKPVSISMDDKEFTYDGTEKSLTASCSDNINLKFTNNVQSQAGTYTVTVQSDNPNYSGSTTATLTINKAKLTVTGLAAPDKTYDGTTSATLTGGELSGIIGNDDVTAVMPVSGTFAGKDVGTNIAITVPVISLSGTKVGNYDITQPTGITGNIIPEKSTDLTINANSSNGDTWTKDDITVTVTAAAPSGIKKYQYSIDNGLNWVDFEGNSLTVNKTTDLQYIFRAISNGDVASNPSSQVTVKVDKANPGIENITGNPTVPTNENKVITFSALDADSKVKSAAVTKGETVLAVTDNQNGTFSFTTQGNGEYIINVFDNASNSVAKTVDVTRLDFEKPVVSILTPANNEINVDTDSLTLTFNENIKKSSINGDITVYNSTGSVFEKIDIQNNRIKVSGNQVKIYFTKTFSANKTYYVTIEKGIILDIGGNSFDGITNDTDWVFKMKKTSEISSINGINLIVKDEEYPAVVDATDETKYRAIAKPDTNGTITAVIAPEFTESGASAVITSSEEGVVINGNRIVITETDKQQVTLSIKVKNSEGLVGDKIYTLIILRGTLETKVEDTITHATVSSEDLKGALDVSSQIDAGKQIQLVLSVADNKNAVTSEQKSEIKSVVHGQTVALYLDISLTLNNITDNTASAIYNTQNPVTIRMQLPEDLRGGSDYKVIRLHNGVTETIDATLRGDYIEFTTDRFSQYAIAYTKPSEKESGSGSTDSSNSSGSWSSNTVSAIKYHAPYIKGYSDNTFKPDNNITRAEVTTILTRLSSNYNENLYYSNSFNDVEAKSWYFKAIGYGSQNGLIKGYEDGSFKPNGNMTRAEFAAMIVRFKNLSIATNAGAEFSDISGHWAENYIMTLYSQGWIKGYADGTFRPDAPITRAEAVKIINAAMGRTPDKDKINANISNYTNPYSDVINTHWAYYEMLEAAINHKIADFN